MLRTALVLIFAAFAAGFLEIPELYMKEEELQALYPLDEAAVNNGLCQMPTDQFQSCQAYFDEALNITNTIQWQQSPKLVLLVQALLRKPDFQNFITGVPVSDPFECFRQRVPYRARQKFYSCMGTNYFMCINRYALLSRPNANWKNVMTYVKLWEHLDLLCNAGFELAEQNWLCINRVEKVNATALDVCRKNFENTLHANSWQHICSTQLVPAFAQCNQKVYSTGCGSAIGWFACEDVRVGYARDCPQFRCNVV